MDRHALVIVGDPAAAPGAVADAIVRQWAEIARLVGFRPDRIITGRGGGVEAGARLAAPRLRGAVGLVVVRRVAGCRGRPLYGVTARDVFRNIDLSFGGDAALVIDAARRPRYRNLQEMMAGWNRQLHWASIERA